MDQLSRFLDQTNRLRDRVPSSESVSHRYVLGPVAIGIGTGVFLKKKGSGCQQCPFHFQRLSGREPQGPIRPGSLNILSKCDQIADRARSRIKTTPIWVSRDARLSGCLSVRPMDAGS